MDEEGVRIRKRKMENNDEENEEEKMEKFFALIRSTREVRECVAGKVDRVKKKANEEEEEEKLKAPVAAGWFPTFQPEDFMADFRPKAAAAAHATEPGGPSTTTAAAAAAAAATDNGNKEDKREGDNLDLKLSL